MAQTGPSWAGYCLPNDADRAAGGMTQYCSGVCIALLHAKMVLANNNVQHSKCGTEGNGCIPNVQNYKGTWIANCGG